VDWPGASPILAAIDRPSGKIDTKCRSHIRNPSREPNRPPGGVSRDEVELMPLRESFDLGDVIRSCCVSRFELVTPDVVPAREWSRSDGLNPLQTTAREFGAQQDTDINTRRRISATGNVGARNGLTVTAAQDDDLAVRRHSTACAPPRHRPVTPTLPT
jgi:hypothetical protein